MEVRNEPRTAPRAVDLRRGRAPEVEILVCETYDFLLSLHVSLASPEYDYADYAVGRPWIESARARISACDASALGTLGRYLGDGRPGSLHATLISLVSQCPKPCDTLTFLDWLTTVPPARFAEVLLDQEGLGIDWHDLLAAIFAEAPVGEGVGAGGNDSRAVALERLLMRYAEDVRGTVRAILDDVEQTRAELLAALRLWYEAVFAAEVPRLLPLLRREAAALDRQRAEMPLEPFIEQTMRGVQWQRPAGLRRVVFAPSYFCRPAVFYHFWQGTLTFCAPLQYTGPEVEEQQADPRAPSESTLRFFEALGDKTRLRILRLLTEHEMYLTELSGKLGLTKATTKHHMVYLRAAGLVTLYDRDRLTYYALRPDVALDAARRLEAYLGLPASAPPSPPLTPPGTSGPSR